MGFTLNQHEQEKQIKKLQKKKDQDTTNYNELSNLPQINGVELKGDKSLSDLGIQTELTFDDTPTDGSNNPVKSDGVYDADNSIYEVMGQMGAKNLIPYPYYEGTEEDRGITWTNQSNGWVVATGTASADSAHNLSLKTVENGIYLPNGTYILNGCPSGGSDSTYYLEAVITKNSSAFKLGIDSGSGVEIEITGDDFSNDGAYVMIRGIVKNAYAIQSSLTFKPMLRLATDTDPTYQPYAKTNKQLTDDITGITPHILPDAPTTDGSYNLKVTVTSGEAAYSWEAVTP